jgi:5-methylcytosine-specific restriction endonuclease McrA
MSPVLVINANGQPLSLLPISVITWQQSIKLLLHDKVAVVKNYEHELVRSENICMPKPSIVMLKNYQKQPDFAKFSRRHMLIRDNFTCQYCNNKFTTEELTIDHVLPRAKNGKTSWTNCTTACRPCNTKKADNIISPINTPHQPSWHSINHNNKFFHLTVPDIGWQDFLNWPEPLLSIDKTDKIFMN